MTVSVASGTHCIWYFCTRKVAAAGGSETSAPTKHTIERSVTKQHIYSLYIHLFLRDSILAFFFLCFRHDWSTYRCGLLFGPVILWKMKETASIKERRTIFWEMENNSMETPKNISHVMKITMSYVLWKLVTCHVKW